MNGGTAELAKEDGEEHTADQFRPLRFVEVYVHSVKPAPTGCTLPEDDFGTGSASSPFNVTTCELLSSLTEASVPDSSTAASPPRVPIVFSSERRLLI